MELWLQGLQGLPEAARAGQGDLGRGSPKAKAHNNRLGARAGWARRGAGQGRAGRGGAGQGKAGRQA